MMIKSRLSTFPANCLEMNITSIIFNDALAATCCKLQTIK